MSELLTKNTRTHKLCHVAVQKITAIMDSSLQMRSEYVVDGTGAKDLELRVFVDISVI